jgi:hypothetical protein
MRRNTFTLICCLAVVCFGLMIFSLSQAAGRGKAVTSGMLPRELKNLNIRDDFVPHAGKAAGVIQTVVGHVVVAHENMRQTYFAAAGDRLYEKDTVFTLTKSRCRFKTNTEDVVTLGENARVGITAFADDRKTQEKRSAFNMGKGKAMFYTMRLFKHKGASMTVSTPTAVAGVRGTKFGVEIIEDGTPMASLPVLVADLSDTGFLYLAQAETSPPVQTNVYAYEGAVEVTSTTTGQTATLGEGEGINANPSGLGNAFQTPPAVSQQFQSDTNIGPPGDSGAGTGTTQPGADTANALTATTDTSSITQNQNTNNLGTSRPAKHEGYFTGMLSVNFGYGGYVNDIFMSNTPQDFDSSDAKATGTWSGYVRIDGTGGSTKQVAEIPNYVGYGGSGLPQPMQRTELGYNAYMEWGSWTQPNPIYVTPYNYMFDNKGYYVWGDATTDLQMAALKAMGLSATYTGNAYGTSWTSTGGADMTGTFSANVDFVGAYVSNFNLSVSGGGHSASIASGYGGFSGNTSHFTLSGGTYTINALSGASGSAAGAVYGPNGEAMGGAWGMGYGGYYANGIFQGKR